MRLIKVKNRLSFVVLLVTWLLVMGLPTMLFRFSLDQFLQNRYQQSLQRIKPFLFTELEQFKVDLGFGGLLEQDLREFNSAAGFTELKSSQVQKFCSNNYGSDAGKIKLLLEKHLGIPVFAVLSHGVDTQTVSSEITHDQYAEIRAPSSTMLRRFFSLLNRQHEKAAISPSLKPAFPAGVDPEDSKVSLTYHENFFQGLIGAAVGLRLEPDKMHLCTASKIGDTGPAFFYYAQSHCSIKGKGHNLGGYLVLIRLCDIPERHIIKRATSHSLYEILERKVVSLPVSIPVPDKYDELSISSFVEHPGRVAVQTMASPQQIVRMVQKGTIVPQDFSAFSGRIAGIEVSCSKSELEHPLAKHTYEINLLLKLLLLAGGILMVRLYLFGFDLNISLAFKISIAVVAAGIMPLLSLALSLVAQTDFARVAQEDKIQRYLRINIARVQQLLTEQITLHEREHGELAAALGKMSNLPTEELKNYLQRWVFARPVHQVVYKRLDAESLEVYGDASRSEAIEKSCKAAFLILNTVVEMLLSSPVLNPDFENISTVLTEGTRNTESTHFTLLSNGRMLNLSKLDAHVRIAFMPVFEKSHNSRRPVAVTTVVYSLEKLIDGALRKIAEQTPLEQEVAGMHLDFALGASVDNVVSCPPKHRSSRLSSDFASNQMRVCSSLKRELQWFGRQAGDEYFSITNMDQTLPIISLARITRIDRSSWFDLSNLARWFYPILILLLILLLSRRFFIAPALRFASGLSAIADGDFNKRLEIDGGDEFATLAVEFNQMAKSLQEKEELESYVSSDVLREARVTGISNLQPGGEKIAATVVFVSLLPAEQENQPESSGQLIARINSFLNLSHVLCTENTGVIDKIIGHTLMMVFRVGADHDSHQLRACRSVMQLVEAVAASELGSSSRVAAGIACGQLVSGKIGSRNGKLDFTVIGDTVNLAARLKSYAESLDGSVILVSDAMLAEIKDNFATRLESEVQLKGKSMQTCVYRIE
ncbi:MAG: adenylate/guanylate cyclase domain-containing protein [Candidatus Riflebacteria bacterium]|nr:adenylate/guanylate cyclase domain-containing protein [Candidatus Riflebacteria bacterium]